MALRHDKKRYWWAYLLSAVCMVYTHIFGLFVFPAGNVFVLLHKCRRHLFVKLLLYQGVVALLFLPWAPFVIRQAKQSGLWVGSWWLATPPALAIPKTLECLGAGGNYPAYLRFPHVSALRFVSYAVFAALAIMAVSRYRDKEVSSDAGGLRSAKLYILLNLFVPILLPYAISFVKPIYLVGRYDFVVYPFYAILIGLGVVKLARFAWVPIVAISLLSSYSLYKYYSIPTPAFDKETVQYLVGEAVEDDVVVVMGLRLCPLEYYMRREGAHFRVLTYPTSMRDHPGWVDFRLSPGELAREASEVTASALAETRPGRRVWLLTYPLEPMSEHLYDQFDRRFRFLKSNDRLGILCFAEK